MLNQMHYFLETCQKETCLCPLSLKVCGGKADESSPLSESLVREHGRGDMETRIEP